ncbi:MAG TPA: hypothetical protein VMW11_04505 [Candidatus Dormibacteraeota bacterium]|nr:hypothetical protein [Candidatus Dormibacteraeota bacterium]
MSWRLHTRIAPAHPRSRARWWVGAMFVAAGAFVGAYLLDPVRGQARRSRIAERTEHLAGRARARISGAMPFLNQGEDAERPSTWPEEAPPDVDSES